MMRIQGPSELSTLSLLVSTEGIIKAADRIDKINSQTTLIFKAIMSEILLVFHLICISLNRENSKKKQENTEFE